VRRRNLNWVALAATVLIVTTLGLALRYLSHPHQFATPGPSISEVAKADDSEPSAPEDAVTVWASDDAGKPQSLHVPLLDASLVDQHFGTQFQSGIPDEVRDKLASNGFQVESKQRYVPLWFDNGRRLVVPVEDMKIVRMDDVVY
jgi:hypothetical protein